MTWNEIKAGLESALALGKVGTPVSLRLYIAAPGGGESWTSWAAAGVDIGTHSFQSKVERLTVSGTTDEREWSVLAEHVGGETTMVTVSGHTASVGRLELVLFGNHGVVRLEGGEQLAGGPQGEVLKDVEAQLRDAASRREPVEFAG